MVTVGAMPHKVQSAYLILDPGFWIVKAENSLLELFFNPATRNQIPASFFQLVGRAGVEPTTNGLKVRCSTY